MRIEFINHACYLLETENVRLLVDPWLEGSAFHNGWALIEPSKFAYERFTEVTHIWFSHEHPDHFAPTVLKKIPPIHRERITVLFQRTKDRKVVDYCRHIGFRHIIELSMGWQEAAPGMQLLNRPHTDGDSWLCLKAGGLTVLNVNDCNLETDAEVKAIAKAIGASPDVLFTQFSYANAIGNKADTALRANFAKAKIDEIHRQIRILQPKYVIPFASFVWFSHEENFFRNDAINTIDKICHEIAASTAQPVVMFNGDRWSVGEPWNNGQAIAKWQNSYKAHISESLTFKATSCTAEELRNEAIAFTKRILKKNSFLIRFWLQPTAIWVNDLDHAFILSLNGLEAFNASRERCDIAIGSEALHYCFKHEWGGSTTRINGRFEVPPFGKFERFKRYFLISQVNNQGETLGVKTGFTFATRMLRSKLIPSK